MSRVTVLYFAAVADTVGRNEEVIALDTETPTVGGLLELLVARHPALSPRLGYLRVARNEAFATATEPLADGDVVALLPPLAGG